MKILHTVEFYDPSVGGMQEVVKRLSEGLAKLGHDVTVATTKLPARKSLKVNEVEIKEFDISGNQVRGFTGNTREYEDYLISSKFDIVTNFAAQQWATDLALPLLDQIKAKRVFVPTGFSALHLPEYQDYFQKMTQWLKQYDMNIFLSDDYQDVTFAKKAGVTKRVLIPNGASQEEFTKDYPFDIKKLLNIPQNHFLILHVGSHTGVKGHKEAIKIFSQAKIDHSTLLIIGNSPLNQGCASNCTIKSKLFNLSPLRLFDHKKIVICEIDREKTVATYQAADLFLFPSNIECSPIVLFESMASRTPFLSTDVGNSKEIIDWSRGGLLLPTVKDFHGLKRAKIKESAKILEFVYNSPKDRKKMRTSGFKSWKQKFNWENITLQYEKLYLNLIKK